tara:strand:- start:14281 stop:14733 length:453 start_codon:yes stop_codon:yes gene_type:complete
MILRFILTGFYIGKIKYAPGTFGTLLAIPLFLLIQDLNLISKILFVFLFFLLSLFLLSISYKRKVFDEIDDKSIVIDEIIGYLVFIIFFENTLFDLTVGFLLFRLFDIIKPYPISLIDKKMKNALGVILDDIIAGLFSGITLFIIIHALK